MYNQQKQHVYFDIQPWTKFSHKLFQVSKQTMVYTSYLTVQINHELLALNSSEQKRSVGINVLTWDSLVCFANVPSSTSCPSSPSPKSVSEKQSTSLENQDYMNLIFSKQNVKKTPKTRLTSSGNVAAMQAQTNTIWPTQIAKKITFSFLLLSSPFWFGSLIGWSNSSNWTNKIVSFLWRLRMNRIVTIRTGLGRRGWIRGQSQSWGLSNNVLIGQCPG